MCLLFALNSCKSQDNAQISDESTEITQERIIGTVKKSSECGFYIESIIEENKFLFMPDNLEEKFRVEGMKLKFGYKASKTKLADKCLDFKPVLLSEVDAMR